MSKSLIVFFYTYLLKLITQRHQILNYILRHKWKKNKFLIYKHNDIPSYFKNDVLF